MAALVPGDPVADPGRLQRGLLPLHPLGLAHGRGSWTINRLLLTGQRRSDIRLMEWSRLDMETRRYTAPSARTAPWTTQRAAVATPWLKPSTVTGAASASAATSRWSRSR